MGKAGKRKEMVEVVWDTSGCKSIVRTSIAWESVCPRTVCEGVVRERSVRKGVV